MAGIGRCWITVVMVAVPSAAIQLWATPGDIPLSVPPACRIALTRNITCDFLVTPAKATAGETVVGEAATVFCNEACSSSLVAFEKAVASGCGNSHHALWATSTMEQSPHYLSQGYLWAHSLMCLSDDSGLCLKELYSGNREACSDCFLKYGAVMASTDYGRAGFPAEDLDQMFSSCSVPASDYEYTYTPSPTVGGPTTAPEEPSATPTCSGETYTVQEADTCLSISKAKSVATDRLVDANHLEFNCTSLAAGRTLCIKDICTLATIEAGQTCDSIVEGKSFTTVQLQSWNPSLKNMCNSNVTPNLDSLIGRSICVDAPGEFDFPTSVSVTHRPTATLTSSWFSEWQSGTVVTDPTDGVPTVTSDWDPDFTPPVTTIIINNPENDQFHEYTKYCWITEDDIAQGYDVESYAMGCQTLFDRYCVYNPESASPVAPNAIPAICIPDRSIYTLEPDPDPVHTPSPVQVGITKGCSLFHKVKAGDTCDSITRQYEVALDDFYTWNPAIGTDCRNLQLGTFACVGYNKALIPTITPPPVRR